MEQIKDRLKQLRHAVGIKQRELADRLEVQVGLIGNWESGARNIPKTRIYQLCKEYNVRKEWLIDGEGEMFVKTETFKDQMKAMFNELSPTYAASFITIYATLTWIKDYREQKEKQIELDYDVGKLQPVHFDILQRLLDQGEIVADGRFKEGSVFLLYAGFIRRLGLERITLTPLGKKIAMKLEKRRGDK
ncbi:MAG: helix-turn-helix domain-containing protein [Thermoguttaceae bacterium]|nr:helix-turn-helix domain-containing protein [Thermoguttaceae bacterium]